MTSSSAFCSKCGSQDPPRRVTADALIELRDASDSMRGIVLIERRNAPFGWALPGGFLDPGEDLERCAEREAREETGLEIRLEGLLGVYSTPGRDPRGLTTTTVYVASSKGIPRAMDDAAKVAIVDPRDPPQPMAFDHEEIIGHYLEWRRGVRNLATLAGGRTEG